MTLAEFIIENEKEKKELIEVPMLVGLVWFDRGGRGKRRGICLIETKRGHIKFY